VTITVGVVEIERVEGGSRDVVVARTEELVGEKARGLQGLAPSAIGSAHSRKATSSVLAFYLTFPFELVARIQRTTRIALSQERCC
jgi:hypothetical protein